MILDSATGTLRWFRNRELHEALAFAKNGGQALHDIVRPSHYTKKFANMKRDEGAHLFDQNLDRLIDTTTALGVKRVKVEHEGKPEQHVDLVGAPLAKAKRLCINR